MRFRNLVKCFLSSCLLLSFMLFSTSSHFSFPLPCDRAAGALFGCLSTTWPSVPCTTTRTSRAYSRHAPCASTPRCDKTFCAPCWASTQRRASFGSITRTLPALARGAIRSLVGRHWSSISWESAIKNWYFVK